MLKSVKFNTGFGEAKSHRKELPSASADGLKGNEVNRL